MKSITQYILPSALSAILILTTTISCVREEDDLVPATFPKTAEVFIDGFSSGLTYSAFGDSKLTAFTVDLDESYEGVLGSASMRFDIPNEGDPEGPYAGGIFRDLGGRDLTDYDALTFWAKATTAGTVDLIGFGNDFMGDKFSTTTSLKLSTSWTKYIIPIPDPSRLTQVKGLFAISEGPENGDGYSIWLDVVKFEKLGTIAHPRPAILNGEDVVQKTFIGIASTISGLTQTFNLPDGSDQTVNVAASYFTFTSSDTTVAKVSGAGVVSVVGEGTAVITGSVGGVDASGSLTIESSGEFTPAPIPQQDPADVISIFSDAYTNVPVDFYNGFFEPFQKTLGGADLEINGDKIIKYTQLNFVATEFKNPTVNATEMTHFHVDILIENAIEAEDFIKIQLGDFGPDGSFGGDDDSNGSITFNTSPPLVSNEWISLDIPLSEFAGLTSRANLAQILFVTDGSVPELPGTITDILVDNMYFYKGSGGGGSEPAEAAPTPPARDAANVVSIFSDAYTDITGIDRNPSWGQSTQVSEVDIAGNNTLLYANFNYQGTDFSSNAQNVSDMQFLHVDMWTADATNVKVTPINGAGSPAESLVDLTPITAGQWVSYDIPLSSYTASGMSLDQVIQLKFDGQAGTTPSNIYLDNIYFYKDGGGGGSTAPTDAPPTPPTRDAADVISIYGEAYGTAIGLANVPWDDPSAFTEENIASNNVLKIGFGSGFLGTDLGNVVDASDMTHFHMDFWISDDFEAGQVFNPKWSNHAGGSGETSSFELTRGIGEGDVQKWVSIDVPITDFSAGDNTQRAELAQFLISVANTIDTAYVDNIYFYKDGGGGGSTAPTDAPPTPPTRDAADVISIYGEAYGTAIGLANVPWDDPSAFTEQNIASNNVLKIGFGSGFLGTDLGSVVDASDMTHFHMDLWISDDFEAGQVFNPKWSNHAGGSGETSSFELTRSIGEGDVQKWVSIDVPITDFSAGDNTQRAELAQFLISVANTIDTAYVDNIYFYKDGGGNGSAAPTDAPPAPPARDATDVISIYGDAYGTAIGLANVSWDDPSVFTEQNIASNNVLKVELGGGFMGSDLNSVVDASGMTHFHMDFWISDDFVAGQVFNPKWSNHAGGGGETSAFELTRAIGGDDVQKWISIDVPITEFTIGDNTQRAELAQFLISVAGTIDLAYIDNIYFYK